ncbi:hypothetical protein AS850_14995 [Frondihabitans sp. 762G35]|uniref:Pycsar system effector family protein n=1 Tax=Frondihabitans sp. 762G35 TaxID=1446794 RepID=UPI000D21C53E|nr:Pycsar system effector family protein [Frondihabitans sp. 762G35]ARC58391.1 hypothetical protein AS850_14995 [Frondihabitans sp. 762G35]
MGKQERAIDNAWKIHDAQLDWTAKADAKAAFAFGLDSAVIAAVVALFSADKVFHHFSHWWLIVLFILGSVLILAGSISSAIGVAPRLRAKDAKHESLSNHIYFGHACHWEATNLEASLRNEDLLPQLSRNIIQAAVVSWKKHVAVTWSIRFTMASGVVFAAYLVSSRFA